MNNINHPNGSVYSGRSANDLRDSGQSLSIQVPTNTPVLSRETSRVADTTVAVPDGSHLTGIYAAYVPTSLGALQFDSLMSASTRQTLEFERSSNHQAMDRAARASIPSREAQGRGAGLANDLALHVRIRESLDQLANDVRAHDVQDTGRTTDLEGGRGGKRSTKFQYA